MSWALKYRPKNLKELVGHKQVKQKIRGMLKSKEIPNAILLTGTTGVGKSTIAKVVTKYLNCETNTACGKCEACTNDYDLLEVNASAERGIDDIRSLVKQAQFKPRFNFRVIVLEECHGLTSAASDALLAPLENPPESTLWILTTTKVQKMRPDIVGRCMRLDLDVVKSTDIQTRLKAIVKKEKKELEDKHIKAIADASGGHVRNSIYSLESVIRWLDMGNKKDDLTDKIDTLITTSDVNLDKVVIKTLLGLYKKKNTVICSAIADITPTSYLAYVNRLIQCNQFLIDRKTLKLPHDRLWLTLNNKTVEKAVVKRVKLTLPLLLEYNKILVDLRIAMQSFSVDERALIVSRLCI